MRVPARCHGENSRDFSVEMGVETELATKKGQNEFFSEKLLEETLWVVTCDLEQGAMNQHGVVERALDSGSWVPGSFSL